MLIDWTYHVPALDDKIHCFLSVEFLSLSAIDAMCSPDITVYLLEHCSCSDESKKSVYVCIKQTTQRSFAYQMTSPALSPYGRSRPKG